MHGGCLMTFADIAMFQIAYQEMEGASGVTVQLDSVFIDGAYVGEGSASEIFKGTGAITPGFGLRYQSPVGPIRIDLGIRPTLKEALPVITQTIDSTGAPQLVNLRSQKTFDPIEGNGGGFRKILRRLSLHLSIGQAF
jgi:hypothetical protein